MKALQRFGAFWYDFVVGDDWRLAIGAALALGGTAIAHDEHVAAWWIAPLVVLGLLVLLVARTKPSVAEAVPAGAAREGPERPRAGGTKSGNDGA